MLTSRAPAAAAATVRRIQDDPSAGPEPAVKGA